MKLNFLFIAIFYGCALMQGQAFIEPYQPVDKTLYQTIAKLDSIFFAAYNSCDMEKQAEFYAENIEFFHDKGGLNTSKTDILKLTKENICGKVTRTLVAGSIEVYPIHAYGAIEIGYHKFFNKLEPNAVSKPNKFIMVWLNENEKWTITKVISLH